MPELVSFGARGGDGAGLYPLELTLLGNGKLYVFRYSSELNELVRYETLLSRKETCQLLNTIDQAGWFEYDTSLYNYDPGFGPREGGPDYVISVNAWVEQSVVYSYVAQFIYGDILEEYDSCEICGSPPPVLPALASTFKLLDSFRPESLRATDDLSIAVFIQESTGIQYLEENSTPWPNDFFALAESFDNASCESRVIKTFSGPEAFAIRNFLNVNFPTVSVGNRYFTLAMTEIVPEAIYPSCSTREHGYAPSGYALPDLHRNLTCSPEDGLLPIPEP